MSGAYPSYKVKTGRFTFDTDSKKVRVSKDKGLLTLSTVRMPRTRTPTRRTTSAGPTSPPTQRK